MPVSAVSVRVTCARGQSVCLCVYDRVTRRTVPHCFFVSPFFVWSLRLSSVYYLVSVCVSEGSLKGPGVDDYFPDLYGSLICCVEAFALDARDQIAACAIGERIIRKVRVLAFKNRVCELLRPRCRIVVTRAVRALPIRTCPFAARAPRAVKCGGEGTKAQRSPSEREIAPARPCRRPAVGITTFQHGGAYSGRLHGRAGTSSSRSNGGSAVPFAASHSVRRGRGERARTYRECPDRAGDYDSTSRSQKLAGTVLESQDTDLSSDLLADSAGGYLVACVERESFRTAYPRTIGDGGVLNVFI